MYRKLDSSRPLRMGDLVRNSPNCWLGAIRKLGYLWQGEGYEQEYYFSPKTNG